MYHLFLRITLTILLGISYSFSRGQNTTYTSGQGGPIETGNHTDCIPASERAVVEAIEKQNIQNMLSSGQHIHIEGPDNVSFSWPLRLKAGLNDPGYYIISGYVDEDGSSGTLDYNCGSRTYDTHQGTDIASWPFPWTKMANNEVEVIAAAAGVITYKADGNFDQQCSWNSGAQGNAIIVQHADGSKALYWHFKSGTLTSKGVGSSVTAGEYLGVVGSSGISTGPHLHFEVQSSTGVVIDPWGGPCNSLGGQSLWQGQKPYWDPRILKIMTHSALPSMPNCPPESVFASNSFSPGNTVYFSSCFRDRQVGVSASYLIKKPDGSTWQSWSQIPNINQNYPAYWWIWNFTLPSNAPNGTWTYQVTCNGQTVTHQFQVGANCSAPSTSQLSVTNLTTNSARLNCSVSGVQQYDWRYRVQGASVWTDLNSTTVNYVNISGLQSGTIYEFQVSVRCTATQWSAWSASKTFTTLTPDCNAPLTSQMAATNISLNAATLNCYVTGVQYYDWRYRIQGTSTWVDLNGTTGSSVNLASLQSATTYEFQTSVRCTATQWSAWSASQTFTTLSQTCSPPALSQLSASNITSSSAVLNCSMSNVQYYDWRYRIVGAVSWTDLNGTPGNSVSITSLQANTTYEFQVSVRCTATQWSAWSVSKTFVTAANTSSCPTPTGLSATDITQNTAILTWNIVPNIVNYTVQFYLNNSWVTIGTTGSNTMSVYGLVPNNSYQWRVIANCLNNQQSAPSATHTFNTPIAPNCTGGTQYPNYALTPGSGWQYQSLIWGGEYCLINVVQGTTYTFSYCSANGATLNFDGEMSIKSTSDQLISYNDDYCGLAPKIVWQASFTGQVRVLLTRYSCQPESQNSTLAYREGVWLDDPVLDDRSIDQYVLVSAYLSTDDDAQVMLNPVETSPETLKVQPNPASDVFALMYSKTVENSRIQVYNTSGDLIYQTGCLLITPETPFEIQITDWPEGLYMVRLVTPDGHQTSTRLVVRK